MKRIVKWFSFLLVVLLSFSVVGCSNGDGGCTHSYTTEITKEATCSKSGTRKLTCSKCGNSYTEDYSASNLTASEVFNKTKDSVGEIITYKKDGSEYALGTGFVYAKDGKILTNYHVIEGAYSAKITLNGVTYTIQSVLAYDKNIDLAVLKINATNLKALKVCTNNHAVGQEVYAFGSSKGLTATFSQGIITYADRVLDGVHYVQHDAATSSGNSGGPLINQFGEVIGIHTMTVKDSQNLNFAISVKEILNLSFDKTLTMAQLYEKESDVFTKLQNYIAENGTYDSSEGKYTLSFAFVDISTDLTYRTLGYYYVYEDYVELAIFLTDGSLASMVFITIDEVDGVYGWTYVDSSESFMSGTLYASTWTSNSLLGVANYSVPSYLVSSIRELASSMVNKLLADIKYDYSDIDVTAADLGFVNF